MEFYHIDPDSLPPRKAAILYWGLPDGSRCRKNASGTKVDTQTLILAAISDGINTMIWLWMDKKSREEFRPRSMVAALLNKTEEPQTETDGFVTAEQFEEARRRILEGK